MNLSLLSNALTLFHMLTVGPMVCWLMMGEYQSAFVLALLAGISDLLDRYLARHYGRETHFGGVVDPLTDEFLLVSTTSVVIWSIKARSHRHAN